MPEAASTLALLPQSHCELPAPKRRGLNAGRVSALHRMPVPLASLHTQGAALEGTGLESVVRSNAALNGTCVATLHRVTALLQLARVVQFGFFPLTNTSVNVTLLP